MLSTRGTCVRSHCTVPVHAEVDTIEYSLTKAIILKWKPNVNYITPLLFYFFCLIHHEVTGNKWMHFLKIEDLIFTPKRFRCISYQSRRQPGKTCTAKNLIDCNPFFPIHNFFVFYAIIRTYVYTIQIYTRFCSILLTDNFPT